MSHPTAAEYNEAIQNLRALSGDDELRDGEVVCNRLGLPMPYSGNFADVYQVRSVQRTVAVKCFTRGAPVLRQRYRDISQHLKRSRLPFMVDFDYESIRTIFLCFSVFRRRWQGIDIWGSLLGHTCVARYQYG